MADIIQFTPRETYQDAVIRQQVRQDRQRQEELPESPSDPEVSKALDNLIKQHFEQISDEDWGIGVEQTPRKDLTPREKYIHQYVRISLEESGLFDGE